MDERQKALEEKKAQRAKLIEDRKKAQIARRDSLRLVAEAKRKGITYEELKMQKENTSEVTDESKTTNNTDEISKKIQKTLSLKEEIQKLKKNQLRLKIPQIKAVYFHPKIQSQRLKSL